MSLTQPRNWSWESGSSCITIWSHFWFSTRKTKSWVTWQCAWWWPWLSFPSMEKSQQATQLWWRSLGPTPRASTDTRCWRSSEATRRHSCSPRSCPFSWSIWLTASKSKRKIKSMRIWLNLSSCCSNSFSKSLMLRLDLQTHNLRTKICKSSYFWSFLRKVSLTHLITWVKNSRHPYKKSSACTFWKFSTKSSKTSLLNKFSWARRWKKLLEMRCMLSVNSEKKTANFWDLRDTQSLAPNSASRDQMAQEWCWRTFTKNRSILQILVSTKGKNQMPWWAKKRSKTRSKLKSKS